jgi:hypothetical protein
MTLFSDQQLLHFNQLGLIPGPGESADEFGLRVNYCLNLKENLSEEFKNYLGSLNEDSVDPLINSFDTVASTYDISPTWIPVFFSNYKLPPWLGGCAWIFQMTETSPTAAVLQLRQNLKRSPKYLGIYHRDELVTHELAHVGRLKFEEPKFEEVLAYHTSPSAFRRWFGPIVQSSFESMLFVIVLLLITCIDIFLLVFHNYEAYLSASWLKAIPISMICLALIRLWGRQHRFNKCLAQLEMCLQSPQDALKVLYRLTDREVLNFAGMNTQEIISYAAKEAANSLRWQLIYNAYFKRQ